MAHASRRESHADTPCRDPRGGDDRGPLLARWAARRAGRGCRAPFASGCRRGWVSGFLLLACLVAAPELDPAGGRTAFAAPGGGAPIPPPPPPPDWDPRRDKTIYVDEDGNPIPPPGGQPAPRRPVPAPRTPGAEAPAVPSRPPSTPRPAPSPGRLPPPPGMRSVEPPPGAVPARPPVAPETPPTPGGPARPEVPAGSNRPATPELASPGGVGARDPWLEGAPPSEVALPTSAPADPEPGPAAAPEDPWATPFSGAGAPVPREGAGDPWMEGAPPALPPGRPAVETPPVPTPPLATPPVQRPPLETTPPDTPTVDTPTVDTPTVETSPVGTRPEEAPPAVQTPPVPTAPEVAPPVEADPWVTGAPPPRPIRETEPVAVPDPWAEEAPPRAPTTPDPWSEEGLAPGRETAPPPPPTPGTQPTPATPADPPAPSSPTEPAAPTAPVPAGSAERGEPRPSRGPTPMAFDAPGRVDLDGHVRRLLAEPGTATLAGYPPALVPRADAAVALGPGVRPVVLVFYDDASKASDLQAAAFLPVLARFRDRIDVVPIDVKGAGRWSEAERRLVRTYYMATVPTTVVLAADRKPLLLKFQRIDGATLEAKLEAAVR